MLQIVRLFLRSQPTPRPSPSNPPLTPSRRGGEVRSQESYGNWFNTSF
ncbi:hypothetical protein [Okeania sp. SIO2B9]|nr:hypothetical protein [Okeania sp. SIO2B9]